MDEGDIDALLNSSDWIATFLNENPEEDCSHRHICNPPGPDQTHTHTCVHVHRNTVPAPAGETEKCSVSQKRPCGNREAVRKYREKNKAKIASLEKEAVQLKDLKQQSMEMVQRQAALEKKVDKLRSLLVYIKALIEGEIGDLPYQKPCDFANPVRCADPCGQEFGASGAGCSRDDAGS